MDFGKAFTFMFEDPDWLKKLLLASLVGLIPIVGQIFLLGWGLEVARRVIARSYFVLPELDFGGSLSRGFQAVVVGLVYAAPILVAVIPFSLIMAAQGNSNELDFFGVIALILFTGFSIFYGLLMQYVLPAALGNLAAKGGIGAGLNFREVSTLIRTAPVTYLIVLLGMLLTGVIGGLGSIACAIGVVVTMAYANAVNGHLIGQAYLDAKR